MKKNINYFLFFLNKLYFIQFFQILSYKVKLRNSHNKLELNFDFKKSNTKFYRWSRERCESKRKQLG
jgi:hypothetical protein